MGKEAISPAQAEAGQIDPTLALEQFQRASQVIEEQYPGALSAFQQYVSGGSRGALDQQTQAQLANLPVSNTATTALEELRGFMGLPSVSPTAGLSTQVNGLINQLQNDPNATNVVSQLQGLRDQLDQAEGLDDAAQREIAKNQITQQFADIAQEAPQSVAPQLQNLTNQFNAGYGQEAGSAWSPDVIQAKLEADPAYQFRMNQGMKALERTAAARGGLLSGNTMAAAQELGQGLAAQQYDKRIGQLQNLAQVQAPGVQTQAGLLQGAGQQLSQTGQQLGAAAGDIGRGIAQAGQQAAQQQGQGLLQSATMQGQMQQQANLQNAQLQQQAALAGQQADSGLITRLIGVL